MSHCHNCPSPDVEEISAVLFTGYGLLLLIPEVNLEPFYQPVAIEMNRWWLGIVLLVCGVKLIMSVHHKKCLARAFLARISCCLWIAIAATYFWSQMPLLPIFGALVCGVFTGRSYGRLHAHLLNHQDRGGAIFVDRHAVS